MRDKMVWGNTRWCTIVQHDVRECDMLWDDATWYCFRSGGDWCDMIRYDKIWCDMIRFDTLWIWWRYMMFDWTIQRKMMQYELRWRNMMWDGEMKFYDMIEEYKVVQHDCERIICIICTKLCWLYFTPPSILTLFGLADGCPGGPGAMAISTITIFDGRIHRLKWLSFQPLMLFFLGFLAVCYDCLEIQCIVPNVRSPHPWSANFFITLAGKVGRCPA